MRKNLFGDLRTQPRIRRRARHDDAGRRGNHQRRHLRNDAITNGQQGVGMQRLAPGHAMLSNTNRQATNNVHQHN